MKEAVEDYLRKARDIAESTGHMRGVKTYLRYADWAAQNAGFFIEKEMIEKILSKGYENGMKALLGFSKEFAFAGYHNAAKFCFEQAGYYGKEVDFKITGDMSTEMENALKSKHHPSEDGQLLFAFTNYLNSDDQYMGFAGNVKSDVPERPGKMEVEPEMTYEQGLFMEEFKRKQRLALYFDSRAEKLIRGVDDGK